VETAEEVDGDVENSAAGMIKEGVGGVEVAPVWTVLHPGISRTIRRRQENR
jgi:hypothetical protein